MNTLQFCPACGSGQYGPHYTFNTDAPAMRWLVCRCAECDHGFLNPQPTWAELRAFYDSTYPAYQPSHGAMGEDAIVIQGARRTGLLRHVPVWPGQRLMDVGCGGGYFLRLAKALGVQAVGIEPSLDGATAARAHGLEVFEGTLEKYVADRPEACFDVVSSNHVLEHVPAPVEALSLMATLLRPGGLVSVVVPNAGCYVARKVVV